MRRTFKFHDENCKFLTCCFICTTFNLMHTIIFLSQLIHLQLLLYPSKNTPHANIFDINRSVPWNPLLPINCGTHKYKVWLTHLLFWAGPVHFLVQTGPHPEPREISNFNRFKSKWLLSSAESFRDKDSGMFPGNWADISWTFVLVRLHAWLLWRWLHNAKFAKYKEL